MRWTGLVSAPSKCCHMSNTAACDGSCAQAHIVHCTHLNECQYCVDDGLFVLETSLLPQDVGQEVHQAAVLGGELEAQRADGLHNYHLEVICRSRSNNMTNIIDSQVAGNLRHSARMASTTTILKSSASMTTVKGVSSRQLEAQRTDGLNHHHLEVIWQMAAQRAQSIVSALEQAMHTAHETNCNAYWQR